MLILCLSCFINMNCKNEIPAISKKFWPLCDQLAFGAGKTMTVTVSPTFLLSRLSFSCFSSEWHMKVLFRKPWKPLGEKSDFKMFCSFVSVCLVMEFLLCPKWNFILGLHFLNKWGNQCQLLLIKLKIIWICLIIIFIWRYQSQVDSPQSKYNCNKIPTTKIQIEMALFQILAIRW